MLKPLKIKSDSNHVFIWSDLHVGHFKPFILEPRGFKDVESMEDFIIDNSNKKVSNDCDLFLLGDTVVGAGPGERSLKTFERVLRRLNYETLWLMPGNHFASLQSLIDKYWYTTDPNLYHILDFEGRKVNIIPNYFEIQVSGHYLILCHYLVPVFNLAKLNSIMCHGHSHGNLQGTELGNLVYKGRIMDIGFDVIPSGPLSVTEIRRRFNNVENVSFDHH